MAGTKEKCHDIAAVKIIVEEAGGKVTGLFENKQRYDKDLNGTIISNNLVHKELLKKLMSEAIQDEMRAMQRAYGVDDGFDKSAYDEADEELWKDEYDVNSELYERSTVDTEETDLYAKYHGRGR